MKIQYAFTLAAIALITNAASAEEPSPEQLFDSAFGEMETSETPPSEQSGANADAPSWDGTVDQAPAASSEAPEAPSSLHVQSPPAAQPGSRSFFQNATMSGLLRNETAYRVRDTAQLTKVRNAALLNETVTFSDDLSVTSSQYGYYDAVFDLTDHYPDTVRDDQDNQLELRDAYVDYSSGSLDLRLGRQQIVWGEAVGLFIADVVNAKDLREFILPDFDLIRRPDWAVDAELSHGEAHLELVYIPFPRFDKIGTPGSEYEFVLPVPDGVPFEVGENDLPSSNLRNSQYGVRASYLVEGWDLGAFYLYSWNRSPAYARVVSDSGLFLVPTYDRQNIVGATFSKEVGDYVFKGELAVNSQSPFSTSDLSDKDGIVHRTYMDSVIGVDTKLFDAVDSNFQLIQRTIFNHDASLVDHGDAIRNYVSAWFKTTIGDTNLEPELLLIESLMEVDLMLRPSLKYRFNDSWDARTGADLFWGPQRGLFGQFEEKARVYFELSYRFAA